MRQNNAAKSEANEFDINRVVALYVKSSTSKAQTKKAPLNTITEMDQIVFEYNKFIKARSKTGNKRKEREEKETA